MIVLFLFVPIDEVDVIGYGSHGSDLDEDQLSVESASSDSGIGLGGGIGQFPHLSITDHV